MKVAKFIADKGWDLAQRDVVCLETGFITKADFLEHYGFEILDEMKIYVDAWELVQVHGLEQSNEIVKNAPSDEHFYSWTLGNSGVKDKTVNIGELRKAITLVEEVESLKEEG